LPTWGTSHDCQPFTIFRKSGDKFSSHGVKQYAEFEEITFKGKLYVISMTAYSRVKKHIFWYHGCGFTRLVAN